MKKSLFFAAALPLLASCVSDELVDTSVPDTGSSRSYISFTSSQKNITRATLLQNAGHYNFGVFAYKSTDAVNNIMENYLVGYMDKTNKKGYYMTTGTQTTLGDVPGQYNGQSQWAYEMLGSAEYNYTGPDGYYTTSQTDYMSNVENQYLKYWDKSAASTTFYAYTPYVNGADKVKYDNASKKLTIADGTIKAKMVNADESADACEFMIAKKEVPSADYGKDVELSFKRLVSKINIKFWEDLQGYSVKILDLTNAYGVSAAPAIAGTPNTQGSYYDNTGIVYDFGATDPAAAISWNNPASISEALNFKSPTATEIGTTRPEATPSESSYYAIPKNNTTGFTFHVSYELTSDTGERIVVQNATVFVPADQCNWDGNTHYTYVFKITEGSNGTTGNPGTIDPNDPKVDPEEALYPIVFDNCTVEDWVEKTYDPIITPDTDTRDYSVVLSSTSFEDGTQNILAATGGSVTVKLYEDTDDITAGKTFSLSGPTGAAGVTLSGSTVTVATGATAGEYTVSWTNTNSNLSPAETYSASFYVIGNYAVSVSTKYIGTNGLAATTLQASTTEAGVAETTFDGTFTIEYPTACPADKKNSVTVDAAGKVTVQPDAFAGDYKVVYKTTEGEAKAAFTVVDYSFQLNTNSVGLAAAAQNVTITGAAALPTSGATSATSVYTISGTPATSKVTIDATTGEVTVAADAATGNYTVTRTVTIDGSETVYEQVFAVKDVYTLSLSKTVVDNDDDITIQVTATKNGVSNVADVDYTGVTGITGMTTTAAAGTIHIGATCPAGTYTVKNGDKTVTFQVQD